MASQVLHCGVQVVIVYSGFSRRLVQLEAKAELAQLREPLGPEQVK